MRAQREKPSYRCVHCGKLLVEQDYVALQKRYSDHVIREHDRPGSVYGANGGVP